MVVTAVTVFTLQTVFTLFTAFTLLKAGRERVNRVNGVTTLHV